LIKSDYEESLNIGRNQTEKENNMAATLRVTPEELRKAAQSFDTSNKSIKTIADSMVGIADELTAVWTGEASVAYCNKLKGLRDGMNNMQNNISKQVENLEGMATVFENAEKANVEKSNELKKDDFV
jgi:WXG100 family type VII secretion target